MNLNPISELDWQNYEWIEVSELSRRERIYYRAKYRKPPPDDGYHYERCDTPWDTEYRWERVYEVARE